MDTITTLHHVNLKTTRLPEMIDWYGTVVGLKPQHVAPVGAFLTNDAASHRLALFAFPGMSDDVDKDSHTGIHHMAFEFSSLDELFGNLARLRTLGLHPQSASITALLSRCTTRIPTGTSSNCRWTIFTTGRNRRNI